MQPCIDTDHAAGVPRLRHGDHAEASVRTQHTPDFSKHRRKAGGLEQLENETHEGRVERAVEKAQCPRVSQGQDDSAGSGVGERSSGRG